MKTVDKFNRPREPKCKLIRDVTMDECKWLQQDFKKGDTIYRYNGCTYGCISPDGSAFTLVKDEEPFFELPNDAVRSIYAI